MSSRPRVYCRIRPLNEREAAVEGEKVCFLEQSGNTLEYRKEKDGGSVTSRFDNVLGNATTQEQVSALLKPEIVTSLFKGYNATVFAYGQTGSGKTYTMEGTGKGKDVRGVIPRLVDEIFSEFKKKEDITGVSVKMAYVQIYQDQIQDLLQARKSLDIKLDKSGTYVAHGALWKEVTGTQQAMQVFADAAKHRATNPTEMNLISSRSHAILQFQLKWDEPLAPGSNAKLNLVDLAGSEKVSLSGAAGEVLKEAIAINKSLSALSNVVKALVEQAKDGSKRVHVPYKDSKLTYLLQSSLGGNNLVHFMLCLSASVLYRNESNSTVEFGKRALKVVLKPVKNPIDYKRLEEMERMIEQMRQHITDLEGKLQAKGSEGGAGGGPVMLAPQDADLFKMEAIKQDDGEPREPAENDALSRHRDGIETQIRTLLEQQRLVDERLRQRDQELSVLKGSKEKDKEDQRRRMEEERQRYSDELQTLRSNISRQRERLGASERDAHAARAHRARRRSLAIERSSTKARLKTNLELERIYRMLPESLHELTSHCILFPDSKTRFRELGGLKKLLALIDCKGNRGRESYIAHAAYALSIALDDEGRDEAREMDGVAAVAQVLQRSDEHSKQFACRALEALVRNNQQNKLAVTDDILELLTGLIGTHPHQQVQEAACSALAEVADGLPSVKEKLQRFGLLKKMLTLIRDTPAEVADLIKVGVTVVGRLAQQHPPCQQEIASLGGVSMLADMLFSGVGERDPQLPVLTAYALVNVCCSNAENMQALLKHAKFPEIRLKLLEGLGRVFSDNIASENRQSATASHTITDGAGSELFSYHGVTCKGEWSAFTAGGRPTYSTFMENPQFLLHVPEDSNISIVLTDTSCEDKTLQRTASKRKTIYMGIAVFRGDRSLMCDRGLKQLDFNGKFVTSGRFNRNRENTLSLSLPGSTEPYVIVPFTAHLMQHTHFVLSVFADKNIEVTHLLEECGWLKRTFEGQWTDMTGRGVDGFEWRNADQYQITVPEEATITAVLSYQKVDDFRVRQALAADDEEVAEDDAANEEGKERPHLHSRVFSSRFAPLKRYVRSNIPSPQNTSFETCNEYLSTSSVKTTMTLQPGTTYTYIPFTETPTEDAYRVSFYCDCDDVSIAPLNPASEWYAFQFSGEWPAESDSSPGKSPYLLLTGSGRVTIIGSAKDVYLLLSIYEITDNTWSQGSLVTSTVKTKKVVTCDAFWANECVLEAELPDTDSSYWVTLQGIKTLDSGEQVPVTEGGFYLAAYAEDMGVRCTSTYKEAHLPLVDRLSAVPDSVGYGQERMDVEGATGEPYFEGVAGVEVVFSDGSDGEDGVSPATRARCETAKDGEIERLRSALSEKQSQIDCLEGRSSSSAVGSSRQPTPPRRGSVSRKSSLAASASGASSGPGGKRRGSAMSASHGVGANAARGLRTVSLRSDSGGGGDASASSAGLGTSEEVAQVVVRSEGLVERVLAFTSLDSPPSAAEFRRLQQEMLGAANKLSAAIRKSAASM